VSVRRLRSRLWAQFWTDFHQIWNIGSLNNKIKYFWAVPKWAWSGSCDQIWSYLCNGSSDPLYFLVLGHGFRGRRIEWRYFQFSWSKSGMAAGRHGEKFWMARHVSAMVHWIHFVFGSTVRLIISSAHKDRTLKSYADLGTEKRNKICKSALSASRDRNFNFTPCSYFWNR